MEISVEQRERSFDPLFNVKQTEPSIDRHMGFLAESMRVSGSRAKLYNA